MVLEIIQGIKTSILIIKTYLTQVQTTIITVILILLYVKSTLFLGMEPVSARIGLILLLYHIDTMVEVVVHEDLGITFFLEEDLYLYLLLAII